MDKLESLDLWDHYRTARYYRKDSRMKAIVYNIQKLGLIVPDCVWREIRTIENQNFLSLL